MIKRYLVVLAILVLSATMFTGCGNGDSDRAKNPFNGGTKGVIGEFEEIGLVSDTSDMNEVYEDEDFSVELTLKNKGEFKIPANAAEVEIQGINADDFGIPEQKTNDEVIDPVTEYVEDGGQVTVDFGDAQYNVTGSFYDANIFAVYNYPYETNIAVPKVCYKGDIREDRVCTVDEEKTVYSSGAPIVATKVEEKPQATKKIMLLITIENVAGGRASTNRDFTSRYDEVNFEVMTDGWTCNSKNESVARLSEGTGQIRCKLDQQMSENDLYEAQFDLELNYFYEDIEKTTVRIREAS